MLSNQDKGPQRRKTGIETPKPLRFAARKGSEREVEHSTNLSSAQRENSRRDRQCRAETTKPVFACQLSANELEKTEKLSYETIVKF